MGKNSTIRSYTNSTYENCNRRYFKKGQNIHNFDQSFDMSVRSITSRSAINIGMIQVQWEKIYEKWRPSSSKYANWSTILVDVS